jgi:hypothetical protein
VAPNGDVAVSQPTSGEVLVISRAGEIAARYGGRGEGPGEFRQMTVIGWQADTLFVADHRLFRVTFFPPKGEGPDVRAAEVPEAGMLVPRPLASAAGGGQRWLSARRLPVSEGGIEGQALVLLRAEAPPLELATLRGAWRQMTITLPDGSGVSTDHPFSMYPLDAVSPSGEHVTVVRRPSGTEQDATYLVTRFGVNGDTIFHVAHERPLPELADETRRAMIDAYAARRSLQTLPGSAAIKRQAVAEALDFPKYAPPITALSVATDDATWLRGADDWQGSVIWEVLDERGMLAARVQADRRLDNLVADAEFVWGTVVDDLNVPYLVRYRLERTTLAR